MSFFDLVVGKPLATTEERAEHMGPIAGIPVFGLDALSSAAYGPEAALTLLIPLGIAGIPAHQRTDQLRHHRSARPSSSFPTSRPLTPTPTGAEVTRSRLRTSVPTPACWPPRH